jgi:hypothetical protein
MSTKMPATLASAHLPVVRWEAWRRRVGVPALHQGPARIGFKKKAVRLAIGGRLDPDQQVRLWIHQHAIRQAQIAEVADLGTRGRGRGLRGSDKPKDFPRFRE